MPKIIHTITKAVPSLIKLFKSKTPEKGKGIVKSGVASLTISGLISTGKISASGIDPIHPGNHWIPVRNGRHFLRSIPSHGIDQLLEGNGEGLQKKQAKPWDKSGAKANPEKPTSKAIR